MVDVFPVAQLAIAFSLAGCDLVELLGVGAFGTLRGAVEFGRARGKTNRCRRRFAPCGCSSTRARLLTE